MLTGRFTAHYVIIITFGSGQTEPVSRYSPFTTGEPDHDTKFLQILVIQDHPGTQTGVQME